MSSTGHARVQELDAEMKDVEAQEDVLGNESACVPSHLARPQVEAARSEGYHAPIASLPPELLSRIFEDIVFSHKPSERFPVPYRLLGISKNWRDTALGTSSLWTYVHLDDAPTMLPLLHQHLERSRRRPLDVYMKDISEATLNRMHPSMELSRWRRLRIHTKTRTSLYNMLAHISDAEAPLLELLTLVCAFERLERVPDATHLLEWNMVGGAPRLAYLHLEGLPPRICMLPGEVLTTLHFNNGRNYVVPYSDFRKMLTRLPALNTLILEGSICCFDEPETALEEFELPCLTTLLFASKTTATCNVSDMVRVMRAPLLRHLYLLRLDYTDFERTIFNMSAGSKFPALRCLALDRVCECPEPATRTLIIASPEVTELIIGDWYWYTWEEVQLHRDPDQQGPSGYLHFLNILAVATELAPQDAWPDLHTITIGVPALEDPYCNYSEFETERGFGCALLECLRARRRANMPIQILRLHRDILWRISSQSLTALQNEVQAVKSFEGKSVACDQDLSQRRYVQI
ncbi:hypothetical protein PLICRDRAFT_93477 [Plicaturopsis crispa FD-325 SS-3]|nr:hypothetical protein PLICRDRAFT_93477 [Plicaturopsis crispa FD-325 SS-3]